MQGTKLLIILMEAKVKIYPNSVNEGSNESFTEGSGVIYKH